MTARVILVGPVRHGLDSSQLFTSSDGQNWTPGKGVKDPLLVGPIVESEDGLIAASARAGQDPTIPSELAWLADGATTWKRVEIPISGAGVDRAGWAMPAIPAVRAPMTFATVLSSSAGMILSVVSVEQGRVTELGSIGHDVPDIAAVSVSGNTVIGITASRLLRSSDGGRSFDVGQISLDGVPLTAGFIDTRHGWIEVQTKGQGESLELTSDGGESWTTIAATR
jgi:hypothetical protein